MAYRQLCAVAFLVLGFSANACGGNTLGSAQDPPTDDSVPPGADDPPPSGSEDPPANDDSPPDSADDAPPSDPQAPSGGGGGRLRQLCEDACTVLERISECPEGDDLDPMTDEICRNNGCAEAAAAPTEGVQCLDEIEALFGCIANLPDICMPNEQQAQQCQDDVAAFSDCAEDAEPPNQPNPAELCTPGRGCDCPTDCAACLCENPGADAVECSTICGADPNM